MLCIQPTTHLSAGLFPLYTVVPPSRYVLKHLEIHTRVGDLPVSVLPVPVDPPSSLMFVFVFADFVLLQFLHHSHGRNQEKKKTQFTMRISPSHGLGDGTFLPLIS